MRAYKFAKQLAGGCGVFACGGKGTESLAKSMREAGVAQTWAPICFGPPLIERCPG